MSYEYPTTLHRSSFDVINILAIFSHVISFEQTPWQRGVSNLRRRLSVITHQPCYPIDHTCPKKEASSPEISNCRLSHSPMFLLTS